MKDYVSSRRLSYFAEKLKGHVSDEIGEEISKAQAITQTALNGKVDKVTGKGLSTEDYTSAEKTKLAGIESDAEHNYVRSISQRINQGGTITLNGLTRISYKPSGEEFGLSTLVLSAVMVGAANGIPYLDSSTKIPTDFIPNVTTATNGLMSYADKNVLDGVKTKIDGIIDAASKVSFTSTNQLTVTIQNGYIDQSDPSTPVTESYNVILASAIGAPYGVCQLNGDGEIDYSMLPPGLNPNDFVKVVGDTMTGNLTFLADGSCTPGIFVTENGTNVNLGWDSTNSEGAYISLKSANHSNYPGEFVLHATNYSTEHSLTGTSDGILTWDGGLFRLRGSGSILVNESINASVGRKSISVSAGNGLGLASSAAAGATQYLVENNYANRIICAGLVGGMVAANEETADVTASIVSVTINGQSFTPDSSADDANNPIVIETSESINPDDEIASIRVYPVENGYSTLFVGQAVGTVSEASSGASAIIGQNVVNYSGVANALIGQHIFNEGIGSAVFGRRNINRQNRAFIAGVGHDTTNGSEGVAALGKWSNITSTSAFVVGGGSSHMSRNNLFEVMTNGSAKLNGTLTAGTGSTQWTDITPGFVNAYNTSGEAQICARNTSGNRIYLYATSAGTAGIYSFGADGVGRPILARQNNTGEVVAGSYWVFEHSPVLVNGTFVYSKNNAGTSNLILAGTNSSDQMFFGYGSYADGLGESFFDGKKVTIRSKSGISFMPNANTNVYTMSLTDAGNIWLGTTSDAINHFITIRNSSKTGSILVNTTGTYGMWCDTNNKWLIYINSSGTVVANTSDIRYKENISDMSYDDALSVLRDVNIINFSYKDDKRHEMQSGVSAQQLRDVVLKNGIKEHSYLTMTSTIEGSSEVFTDITMSDKDIRYEIDYSKLVPVLWKGWQYQDNKIKELEAKIRQLEAAR